MSSTAEARARSTRVEQASRAHRFWRSGSEVAPGGPVVSALTVTACRLHVDSPAAALLYLLVVVLTSHTAGRIASLVVSIIAVLCLDYFFSSNRAAQELYGFSREDAIGHSSHELLHTEHIVFVVDDDASVRSAGTRLSRPNNSCDERLGRIVRLVLYLS